MTKIGGDVLDDGTNRAVGWFIASIISSIIIGILLIIINDQSPIILLLVVIFGFSIAGSVYEHWIGCKK
jgi:hypothetical protein